MKFHQAVTDCERIQRYVLQIKSCMDDSKLKKIKGSSRQTCAWYD